MARATAAPAHPAAPRRRPVQLPYRRPSPPQGGPAGRAPRGAVVLDALLQGRGWIVLLFVLLAGIVFFNVDLLRMNRQIAYGEEHVGALKRENARLRTDLARLGSSERIQRVAAARGLVLPAPGEVRYLRSSLAADTRRALARLSEGTARGAVTPERASPASQAPPGDAAAPQAGVPAAAPQG